MNELVPGVAQIQRSKFYLKGWIDINLSQKVVLVAIVNELVKNQYKHKAGPGFFNWSSFDHDKGTFCEPPRTWNKTHFSVLKFKYNFNLRHKTILKISFIISKISRKNP